MNEKKGQVKGFVQCPECGNSLDLSRYCINPETLSEEVTQGQYRRPSCTCGCKFGYNLIRESIEAGSKTNEVTTAP